MPSTKNYFHDKIILLLLTSNFFLVLLLVVVVLLRIGGQSGSYIDQYRSSLGIGAFHTGSLISFISFIVFGVLTLGFAVGLSVRAYHIRRQFAICLLSLSLLLLVLAIIVSNALLILR